MKKIVFLITLIPFLLAFQCDPEPPYYGNFIEFEKPDLITINNQQDIYQVGDTIWLSATVDRFQVNPVTEETYDLFSSSEKFNYYLEFTKTSLYNGSYNLYLNENTTVVEEGEIDWNSIILTKQNEQFKSKIGIKLLESGTYSLYHYTIASYDPSQSGSTNTRYSIVTDFSGMESKVFTFEVE